MFLSGLALSACSVLPESRTSDAPRSAATTAGVASTPSARQCLASLDRTGSHFSVLPDRFYGAGCSTLNAVSLTKVGGDRSAFGLSNLGPVACPTASAFAGWARYGVDRAARQILGSPLVKIETMGSYACRNIAGSSRRSAHSKAEAIDVAAFLLADGRRISVRSDWQQGSAKEREFLRVVHRSACKRFGTVLGPEYNAAHRDHFHFETGGRNFCR